MLLCVDVILLSFRHVVLLLCWYVETLLSCDGFISLCCDVVMLLQCVVFVLSCCYVVVLP